jgi:site-specific recombinase XerD
MNELKVEIKEIENFCYKLLMEERSQTTVKKYFHDIKCFFEHLGGRQVSREEILSYKEHLGSRYAISSANSMIAALNSFLKFLKRDDLCVKQFRVQRDAYCKESRELSKEEYFHLVESARNKKNERLGLIIETICSTGIRISELCAITAEALKIGEATVNCKGKFRRIFLPAALCRKLSRYAASIGVEKGPVFVTKRGKPISRHSVWREMKSICEDAGVSPSKVFPHNLRHLFARTFYGMEHDIVKLADVLGHSNIETTRIYVITSGSEHRKRIENMGLVVKTKKRAINNSFT